MWIKQAGLFFGFLFLFSFPSFGFERIVSLKPNITENLFFLGVGKQVVGVTTYCDYPESVKKLPKIADYITVNVEKTMLLKPDLILASQENSSKKEIVFLKQRGFRVETFQFGTVADVQESLIKMGNILGKKAQGEALVRQMKDELSRLKESVRSKKRLKVMFVVGTHPLVVAGGHNFFNEATDYTGFINVFGKSRLTYPRISSELLIAKAPEIIFDFSMGSENSRDFHWLENFKSVPAVKNGRIYKVPISLFRATPRLSQGYQFLIEKAYGTQGL